MVKEDFSTVYETNFSGIYNYVFSQLMHRERTEDLVSEIFIKAMTHYDEFDPEKASIKTWLSRIARNSLIDTYRKRENNTQSASLDDEESTFPEPSYEEEYSFLKEPVHQEVYMIMQKLNPQERELLSMIYFQEMKNPEIAQVLGINAKAVSERHRRVLAKCRGIEKGKDLYSII